MTNVNRSFRIAIASDHAGISLKKFLKEKLKDRGHEVYDIGPETTDKVDYPDYANMCCNSMEAGFAELGILICGSGIGMSIAANRRADIRCALVSEPMSAELSRKHNNSNVIAMGARLIGEDMAWKIVTTWLTTPFEGGRHEQRIAKLG